MDGGPGNARALDCGAGIGRITKHLLTKVRSNRHVMMVFIACLTKVSPNTCSCCVDSVEQQMFFFFKILAPQHFERVDLLEQDKHFLEKAVEYLDGNNRLSTCSLKYLSAWTATSKYSSLYTVNIWILGW